MFMKTIWKFEVPDKHSFTVDVPKGAVFLSVQTQHGEPMMWWLVDPTAAKEKRVFDVVGTGWDFDPTGLTFLGTYQVDGGTFVFHLFERNAPGRVNRG